MESKLNSRIRRREQIAVGDDVQLIQSHLTSSAFQLTENLRAALTKAIQVIYNKYLQTNNSHPRTFSKKEFVYVEAEEIGK